MDEHDIWFVHQGRDSVGKIGGSMTLGTDQPYEYWNGIRDWASGQGIEMDFSSGSDRELTLEQVRKIAGQLFPEFRDHLIRYIGSGWGSDVYCVNEEWVLRFPRRLGVVPALEYETSISPVIVEASRGTGVNVPDLKCVEPEAATQFPYPIGLYKYLSGTSSEQKDWEEIDWNALVTRLGKFLTRIHSIPVNKFPNLEIPMQQELFFLQWLRYVKEIYEYINSLSDQGFKKCSEWLLHSANPPEPYSGQPKLIHNDFNPEHIIFAPGETNMTAVIDWEDAMFGDPVSDFVTLPFWMGWDRTRQVINRYELALDSGFFERLEFTSKLVSLAWLYDESDQSDDLELQKSYVRRVFELESL